MPHQYRRLPQTTPGSSLHPGIITDRWPSPGPARQAPKPRQLFETSKPSMPLRRISRLSGHGSVWNPRMPAMEESWETQPPDSTTVRHAAFRCCPVQCTTAGPSSHFRFSC